MKNTFSSNERKMAPKILSLFFAVSLVLLLTSCTTAMTESVVLATDYEQPEDDGYVYGNFGLSLPPDVPPFSKSPRYPTIGIIVKNLDTSEKHSFVLEINSEDQFQIAALPPGNYRIDSIEHVVNNKVSKTTDFDADWYQKDFVVESNTAVYIGDFTGSASVHITDPIYSIRASWSLEMPMNNYDESTVTIKEMYPFLTELPITFVSNMNGSQVSDS